VLEARLEAGILKFKDLWLLLLKKASLSHLMLA